MNKQIHTKITQFERLWKVVWKLSKILQFHAMRALFFRIKRMVLQKHQVNAKQGDLRQNRSPRAAYKKLAAILIVY